MKIEIREPHTSWAFFWKKAFLSLGYTVLGCLLVPAIWMGFQLRLSSEESWAELLQATRIGYQIGIFSWVSFTALYAALYSQNPLYVVRFKSSLALQISSGLVIMVMGLGVSAYVEPLISGDQISPSGFSQGLILGGIVFSLVIFAAGYREVSSYALKLRAQSAEANLQVLKNQMQPHFLFNSLNSLVELIESDPKLASKATLELSELYREILEASKKPLSTVGRELGIVRQYLSLEKIRFGERLHFEIDDAQLGQQALSEKDEPVLVPSLLLQTLVENAVKHGISKSLEGGWVRVRARVLLRHEGKRCVEFEVSNSGSGVGLSPLVRSARQGTGLENARARLDLLYGERHGFELSGDESVTSARFRVFEALS